MKVTHFMKGCHIALLFAAVAAGLSACSGTTQLNSGLVSRLKNRGPVALSSDNPYLAANMFVASTMQKSPIISGFIKKKGAPTAVEIDHQLFAPMVLYFYYLKDREYYKLEESLGTWIIQGPNRIDASLAADLGRLSSGQTGEAALLTDEPESVVQNLSKPPEILADTGPHPLPSPTTFLQQLADDQERLFKTTFKSVARPHHSTSFDLGRILKLQKAAEGHPAERAPNGDLVHHVSWSGETLSAIALWYTHDRGNAPRLARINRIKKPDSLQIGDTVIIPAYLVKNGNRLTEDGLAEAKKP